MMYEYCEANGLPHERCGKLICAANEKEAPVLKQLLATGTANGVEGLEIISGVGTAGSGGSAAVAEWMCCW